MSLFLFLRSYLLLALLRWHECSAFFSSTASNLKSYCTQKSSRSSAVAVVSQIAKCQQYQSSKYNSHQPRKQQQQAFQLWAYGKNAEIWPETNEDPVQLSDSFPNGEIPYSAIMMIEQQDMTAYHENVGESIARDAVSIKVETNEGDDGDIILQGDGDTVMIQQQQQQTSAPRRRGAKRQFVSRSIRRILRRAAAKEELDAEPEPSGLDKTPIVVALALLFRGLVRPLDIALVCFFTGYGIILGQVARSPRETSGAPILPATPPQGHVPTMVSNPLGMGIMYSKAYDLWLKLGVLIGLVGPVALLLFNVLFAAPNSRYEKQIMEATRICARPIFLLCCQAISEAFSRKVMAPLPLRILVPLAYNTARLPYLWQWICFFFDPSLSLSLPSLLLGRVLGITNGLYWAANLFAFLIPVAAVRYMRAHFFGVEAMEVTTRLGMEESVGLIPNQ